MGINLAAVVVPSSIKPPPEDHEITIAWMVARHYGCIVEFLQPSAGYKIKTPDIVMNGVLWEIKSPTGNSKKSTVQYQFKGLKQSRNLIIDGRRTKLDDALLLRQMKSEILKHSRVGKVIFITKQHAVIEI